MKKYLILLVIPLFCLRADVTKETFMSMKMAGGMVNMEQNSRTEIRPSMKLDDDMTKVKVTIISGKPQHKGTITRLDKGAYWYLDHDAKTWRELEIKMPEYKGKVEVEAKGSGQAPSKYRVVKSEFLVTKLDEKKDVNGWPCTGYVVKWTLVVEQESTREQSTSIMTTNLWTTETTEVIKTAQAEEKAFDDALMAKLNANVIPDKTKLMGAEYLIALGISQAAVTEGMIKAAEEMSKIQGYPIVTEVKWEVPGDTTAKKAPEAKPKSTGMFGLPNVRDMVGNAIEKKVEEQIAPKPGQAGVVFTSHLEVKSLKVAAVPDKDFEIPEGYKKVQ